MRTPLRFLLPLLVLAAACTDRTTVTPPVTEPEPEPSPLPLGVYEFTITGIGTDQFSATAERIDGASGSIPLVSASLSASAPGLEIESATYDGGFFEGGRGVHLGQRYVTLTYRVRNGTGAPVNNVTFIPVSTSNTISGTPFRALRRFDGALADPSIATQMVPTGASMLGDGMRMISPVQDVLQVFTEAEVAAITLPEGVSNIFPYGFVVRSGYTPNSRLLPATADPTQFDGQLSFAFRMPRQSNDPGTSNGETKDVFTFVVQMLAVQDTETRLTETIEESRDTAAVRRLRARATAMGATTVTVLAGSPATDPAVVDYPGQRQICTVRTAGTPGSPLTTITSPGGFSELMVLAPGESLDPCAAYFRSGTPDRPATNVPFTVTAVAMDRYGNVKPLQRDTVQLEAYPGSPPATFSPRTLLVSGQVPLTVTYSDYGSSRLHIRGNRLRGTERTMPIAGVTRTWTAGAGTTSWHTGGNWQNGAVPMSLDSVLIPASAPLFPQLAQNVAVRGVTVENNATLSLGSFDLTAGANVFTGISGGINSSVGRLWLTGTAATVQGNLPRLRVTGTYSLTGNVTTVAPTRVEAGRLRNERFRVRAVSQ